MTSDNTEEGKIDVLSNTRDSPSLVIQGSQDHGSNRDVIISIRRYDETENNCIEETSRCLPSSNVRHNINHDTVSDGNRHDAPPSYSQIPGTVPLHSGRNNGPPPSYDEVIDPHVGPPSYNSLFGQVREARKSANGILDFIRKLLVLLLGTLGVTILVGFYFCMPVTMILIGFFYMDQCPAENIPIFLIVGGVIWTMKNILNFWSNCHRNCADSEEARLHEWYHKRESWLNSSLFLWFIVGGILVYRIYPPAQDPADEFYCNKVVYFFAFYLVTLAFMLFIFLLTCLCWLTFSSMVITIIDWRNT